MDVAPEMNTLQTNREATEFFNSVLDKLEDEKFLSKSDNGTSVTITPREPYCLPGSAGRILRALQPFTQLNTLVLDLKQNGYRRDANTESEDDSLESLFQWIAALDSLKRLKVVDHHNRYGQQMLKKLFYAISTSGVRRNQLKFSFQSVDMSSADLKQLVTVGNSKELSLTGCRILQQQSPPNVIIDQALRTGFWDCKSLSTLWLHNMYLDCFCEMLHLMETNATIDRLYVSPPGGEAPPYEQSSNALSKLLKVRSHNLQVTFTFFQWASTDGYFSAIFDQYGKSESGAGNKSPNGDGIGFQSCTFDVTSCRLLKSIYGCASRQRKLSIRQAVNFPENEETSTLADIVSSAPGLHTLSLTGLNRCCVDIRNSTAMLSALKASTCSVMRLHISAVLPIHLELLVHAMPYLWSLKNLQIENGDDLGDLKHKFILAMKKTGSIEVIAFHSFQSCGFSTNQTEVLKAMAERNGKLPHLIQSFVDTKEKQNGSNLCTYQHCLQLLAMRALIDSTGTSWGSTKVFHTCMLWGNTIGPMAFSCSQAISCGRPKKRRRKVR